MKLRNNPRFQESSRLVLALTVLTAGYAFSGPKGEVLVRPLGKIKITIDGDFSDWPLENFKDAAEQPLFPDGQLAESTDARGDHIVFDRDRIGRFNGTPEDAWLEGPDDFGCTVYFAYDSEMLYVLAIFIDNALHGSSDPGGCQNFLNDGFEFFIDAQNDSDDCVSEIVFPDFDTEEPNLDDFQLTVGLNDFFLPAQPAANELGARQHLERAGTVEAIEGGAVCREGSIYREALDELDFPNIAAKAYDDLREAGARNPEILENPDIVYPGYAIELVVPFGWIEAFDPAVNSVMGFELFWRDVDGPGDPAAGGGGISWASWAQSTEVACHTGNPQAALFQASNWGELVFVDDPLDAEPGELFTRGDVNADDQLNIADPIALLAHLFGGEAEPSCRDAADANDDGALNIADAVTILGYLFQDPAPLPAPFTEKCEVDPTDDDLECNSFPPCGG